MGLYNKLPDELHEVDVIISGGGSAGCVIAARLAEADRNLSILLIEQGMNNHNLPEVIHPALFPQNLFPDSKTALFWQGNHAPQLANRDPVVPSGGILGGGSSINWMVYTRAQRSDFNSWRVPGWTADELWPYLKKFETYHGRGDKEHHGATGPINVSSGTFRSRRAEDDFINAAANIGYPELKDLQNLDDNNGVERWLRYVGPDGRRQDAAHRYIHPKLQGGGQFANLHVLVETQTVRVLFDDDKRAVGVECQPNPRFQPADGARRTVGARRLVVLSSGANSTPQILERSGVGDSEVLARAGVPVVEHLPGVGHDYQDHHLSLWTYRTSLTADETINGFANGRFNLDDMVRCRHPLLGWNAMDASGKFRPTEAEVAALGPAFKTAWDRDFRDIRDRPLMVMGMYLVYLGDHSALPDGAEYITMANWTAYPYSRGHIHITGPDLGDRLDFDVGYLTDAADVDVKKHVWAYKKARELARRMGIYRGELAADHPRFAAGSPAAVQETADGPVPADAPPIHYSADDDRAIEQATRESVGTTWHSLGTCKMAPRDRLGVVDPALNVHGLKALKVADLSVPPENVGANTNNTALMIGEKAADIFIKELGL